MNPSIGWREWVQLPDLGIPAIKAKIDTGAKTSCLHAFVVDVRSVDNAQWVDFKIHPLRKRQDVVLQCTAPLVDSRVVRDSGGHEEERLVISSAVSLGEVKITTEFTLTRRDDMIFPMLLGRSAIKEAGFLVDVKQSYVHGRVKVNNYNDLLKVTL